MKKNNHSIFEITGKKVPYNLHLCAGSTIKKDTWNFGIQQKKKTYSQVKLPKDTRYHFSIYSPPHYVQ